MFGVPHYIRRWQKFYKHTLVKYYSTSCKMDEKQGLPLKNIINELNNFANVSLAESWDNVGLLIEPTKPKLVSQVLLTNDLTEDVVEEAVNLQVDLIISYHPPIFAPLKSITTEKWKERIAATCLENKIALYSPHTSFDAIQGGVNDWLAAAFDTTNSDVILPNTQDRTNGMGRICTLKARISLAEAVERVKRQCGLKYVRLARARNADGFVNTVAVCAGSGATVLKGVKADLYVTGEMLHHDVLDAVHSNTSVILTNHSDSERGFLKTFAETLTNMLNRTVKVVVSEADADPLKTV